MANGLPRTRCRRCQLSPRLTTTALALSHRLALLPLLLGVACIEEPSPDDGALEGIETGDDAQAAAPQEVVLGSIDDAATEPVGALPTLVRVHWTAPEAGLSWVEWGEDGDLAHASPARHAEAGPVDVTVLGLAAGTVHDLRVVTEVADGGRYVSEPFQVTTGPADERLPTPTVVERQDQEIDPDSYVMVTLPAGNSGAVAILDRQGRYVWWHIAEDATHAMTAVPSRDGRAILYMVDSVDDYSHSRLARVLLSTGEEVSSTPLPYGHHDFVELADGRIAYLAYVRKLIDYDGDADVSVTGDAVVIAGDRGGQHDPVVLADLLDGWKTPAPLCEHGREHNPYTGGVDWSHANSLIHDEEAGVFLVMNRHLDDVLAIDDSSGQLLWELGGADSDFSGSLDPLFSHPHMSEASADRMLVFDNGLHASPPMSTVRELTLDHASGTYTETWSYSHPSGDCIEVIGDAHSTASGNTLITWSTQSRVDEVTRDGQVAWSVELAGMPTVGRSRALSDLYGPTDD